MNKTVVLIFLACAISIMFMMNSPAIMAVSPDTKIVLTLLFFVSLISVVLYALGFAWKQFATFAETMYNKRVSKKNAMQVAMKTDMDNISVERTFRDDIYLIGDAIHGFGYDGKCFEKDEKGNILVSPDAAKTIADCGSELRRYATFNTAPNQDKFNEVIYNRLHDACFYNGDNIYATKNTQWHDFQKGVLTVIIGTTGAGKSYLLQQQVNNLDSLDTVVIDYVKDAKYSKEPYFKKSKFIDIHNMQNITIDEDTLQNTKRLIVDEAFIVFTQEGAVKERIEMFKNAVLKNNGQVIVLLQCEDDLRIIDKYADDADEAYKIRNTPGSVKVYNFYDKRKS